MNPKQPGNVWGSDMDDAPSWFGWLALVGMCVAMFGAGIITGAAWWRSTVEGGGFAGAVERDLRREGGMA